MIHCEFSVSLCVNEWIVCYTKFLYICMRVPFFSLKLGDKEDTTCVNHLGDKRRCMRKDPSVQDDNRCLE